MVCKSNFVAFSSCIDHKICNNKQLKNAMKTSFSTRKMKINYNSQRSEDFDSLISNQKLKRTEHRKTLTIVKVKQKAAHILVINFPTPICFVLWDNLQTNNIISAVSSQGRNQDIHRGYTSHKTGLLFGYLVNFCISNCNVWSFMGGTFGTCEHPVYWKYEQLHWKLQTWGSFLKTFFILQQ